MKNVYVLSVLFCFISILSSYSQKISAEYFRVDSNILIKFIGKPEKYFYQTPLGDITIFEYKPEINANDSNCLYSIALYRPPLDEVKDNKLSNLQLEVKFNSIISSEDIANGNLGGKVLSKNEIILNGIRRIRMKILFSGLTELNEIEGQKDIIYNAEYLRYNDIVIKLWTYTPLNKENMKIYSFFNSLRFD